MSTPSDPTTPAWTPPSGSGAPERADDHGPAPVPGGAGGPSPAGVGGGTSSRPAGSAPAGGWGPGYTSPPPAPGTLPGLGAHRPGGGTPPAYGGPAGADPRRYAGPAGFGAPRPGIVPLRPLGLGEILDGAFRAIRANPSVMFGLSAIVVAVTVTIQSVLQWYLGGLVAGQLASVADTLDPTGAGGIAETLPTTVATLATSPLMAMAVTVLTGLLIVSVSRSVIGRRIGVGEVWAQSRRRVGVLLLFSFAITVLVLAVWAGFVAALAALGAAEQWGAAVTLGLVGGLGLLVATVWFSIRTLLIPATLVLEGTGVGTALRRGWRLTRGSTWRLLGIYALTSVMAAIVASLIVTPAQLVAAFVLRDPLTTSFGSIVLLGVADVAAYTLTTAFTAAVLALLYIDVRMRREGLDVELARAAGEAA